MFNGIFCVYKVPLANSPSQIAKYCFETRYCGIEICRRDVVTKGHLRFVPILLPLYTADKKQRKSSDKIYRGVYEKKYKIKKSHIWMEK